MICIIGDTIRLVATIKDFDGNEVAPGTITVTVYKDADMKLLDAGVPTLKTGTTSHYFYDWQIAGVSEASDLTVVWEWSGAHIKKMILKVEPVI